jgi:hypothetical protein
MLLRFAGLIFTINDILHFFSTVSIFNIESDEAVPKKKTWQPTLLTTFARLTRYLQANTTW